MNSFKILSLFSLVALCLFQLSETKTLAQCSATCSNVTLPVPCCKPDNCCFRSGQPACCPCLETFLCPGETHLCTIGATCSADNLTCEKDGVKSLSFPKL